MGRDPNFPFFEWLTFWVRTSRDKSSKMFERFLFRSTKVFISAKALRGKLRNTGPDLNHVPTRSMFVPGTKRNEWDRTDLSRVPILTAYLIAGLFHEPCLEKWTECPWYLKCLARRRWWFKLLVQFLLNRKSLLSFLFLKMLTVADLLARLLRLETETESNLSFWTLSSEGKYDLYVSDIIHMPCRIVLVSL